MNKKFDSDSIFWISFFGMFSIGAICETLIKIFG